jgi:hypothetical protein
VAARFELRRALGALSRPGRLWLLLLLLPAFELGRHALIRAQVPEDSDYRAAAELVRGELQPTDLITAAPGFIDPILRLHLGDRIPLAMAGRSDDSAYERMWVISIRGALPASAPSAEPELSRDFGHVRVLRYALGPSPVLFDFVSGWRSARATIDRSGGASPCPLRKGSPRGGGLGKGALLPLRERYDCEPSVPWLSVGPVVLEDLDNQPRHCLWQHPQGAAPIRMTFEDVPLGEELIFYGGLYYEHERMREGGPIEATISIDDQERARMVHRDGEGWKRLSVPTTAAQRGKVEIAVSANDPRSRSFCWSATTRKRATGRDGSR